MSQGLASAMGSRRLQIDAVGLVGGSGAQLGVGVSRLRFSTSFSAPMLASSTIPEARPAPIAITRFASGALSSSNVARRFSQGGYE
jgi:hypothetical protein